MNKEITTVETNHMIFKGKLRGKSMQQPDLIVDTFNGIERDGYFREYIYPHEIHHIFWTDNGKMMYIVLKSGKSLLFRTNIDQDETLKPDQKEKRKLR